MDPRHPNYHQHPSYPGSNPSHPNHCVVVAGHPGYPGNVQFTNPNSGYPPSSNDTNHFNPNCQGQFPGHPNLVTVQMHRPDPGHFRDQQMQRRSAPLGTAAVVFRGGGPHGRSNAPSGENAYFVLDADAVVDEPLALLADPMSLPRTQNRINADNQPMHPPTAMVRSMGADDRADTFLKPLVTSDGKCVEDIILSPIEHPGTNGKFYIAPNNGGIHNDVGRHDQPIFLGKGSDYPRMANGGSNEKWPPPPPMDLTAKPILNSESYENGSLQAPMRPHHDGHGHKRSIASGSDIDMLAGNNPLGSLP